jgi:hypothetical protein
MNGRRFVGSAARIFLAGSLTKAKAIGWIPIHALALSAALLWLTAYLFPREFEIPVKAASLVPNGGHAFVVRLMLPKLPPYLVFRADGLGAAATASALELAEDGGALGPPHALHSEIREKGEGRFSHWYHDLYFSASDNTNPQVNGRVYTVKIPAAPSVWLSWTAIGLIMLSLSLLSVVRRSFRFILVTVPTSANRDARKPPLPTVTDLKDTRTFAWHRIDKTITRKTFAAVLFCAFFVLAFRLRQRDLEFVIEPDFGWQLVGAWRAFLSTLNTNLLPVPHPIVYPDGQFIVYAIADAALRELTNHVEFLRQFFPNDFSFALGAALLTNNFAYAAACVIFFAACYRLTGRLLIAALASIGLFFAPEMLNVNIGRVDFLNTLPIMAIFYCSCVLALGRETRAHAVALGVALAFAATLKINGLFFGIFPALAALTRIQFERTAIIRLAAFTTLSVASFLPVFVILMARYIYYLSVVGLVQYYRDSIALQMQWSWEFEGPPLYYNYDLVLRSGLPFIALYLTCFTYVLFHAVSRRSRGAMFLSLCFMVLSLAGMFTQKYVRGGYHLLPVFFALIALAAAEILNADSNRIASYCLFAIGGLAFALTLVTSVINYQRVVAERKADLIGVRDLKRAPRDWLRAHIAPGTTICIQTHSDYTLPPLDGFNVVDGPLALPYLDKDALARANPPSLVGLKNACPVIITSNTHRGFFDGSVKRASQATETRWADFFQALNRRYPPKIFASPVSNYAKEIYINDLRSD